MQARHRSRPHSRQISVRPAGSVRRPIASPWHFWMNGETTMVSAQDELIILKDPALKPVRDHHGFTQEQAIKLALRFDNEQKDSSKDAGSATKQRAAQFADLPFHIFNDIDATLFSGLLRGNVYLAWAKLSRGLSGRTTRPGRQACPRIAIELSHDIIGTEHPGILVSALLHQMIHAYLLQCCGHKNAKVRGSGHNLAHNVDFAIIAMIIQDRISPVPKQEYPATLGCWDPYSSGYVTKAKRNVARTLDRSPPMEAGSSICDARRHGPPIQFCGKMAEYIGSTTTLPKVVLQPKSPLDHTDSPR